MEPLWLQFCSCRDRTPEHLRNQMHFCCHSLDKQLLNLYLCLVRVYCHRTLGPKVFCVYHFVYGSNTMLQIWEFA